MPREPHPQKVKPLATFTTLKKNDSGSLDVEEPAEGSRSRKKESPKKHVESGQVDSFDALLEPFYYGKHLTDRIDTARDKWNLLPAFLKVKGLVKQHLDSYNYFIEVELKNIVRANQWILSDVDHRFWFKYTNIYVGEPSRLDSGGHQTTITPNECRLRDMTYSAPILVDFEYLKGQTALKKTGVQIGRLPVMLRGKNCVLTGISERQMGVLQECAVDPGGYFIVRGQERVILVQEQLSKNRIIVESQKGIVQASVTSSTHERKSKTYVLLKKDRIYLRHNVLSEDIPIIVILKAMGLQSDQEIMHLTAGKDSVYQDLFAINFEETATSGILTQEQALEHLGSKVRIKNKMLGSGPRGRNHQHEALEALANVIIPHVPVERLNFRTKSIYIAFMVRRVLMAMHDPKLVDDRDYVGNKRLELAGQMLSLLFEDHFKRFNTEFKTAIDRILKRPHRTEFDAVSCFQAITGHITAGIERALATGNWNLKRFKMERAGVTHVLSRLSYISALGMMTRITSQFEKTRKVSGPRALQSSQFGMLCLCDTPEGEACGLVKNLALMTHITTANKEQPVETLVFLLGAEDVNFLSGLELYDEGSYIIFLNGTPIGLTNTPRRFLRSFRLLRRRGRVSEFVSIHINDHYNAVQIATDDGRICRPLIVVDGGKSQVTKSALRSLRNGSMTFDDFLRRGLVEYLDVNEENDSNIAMYEADINPNTTHLEIEPFTILGVVAGLIPYPHHNQSPRNTYQCAMGKQAIGAIGYNQLNRIDTLLYLMVYPQKPLVKTRTIELIKYDRLPGGQNGIVAIMSFSGYDIEDALVVNKASCDRGFGRCQVFRKTATFLKKLPNGTEERFGQPADKPAHRHLDRDGLVAVGARLKKDDALFTKRVPLNESTIIPGNTLDRTNATDVDQTYKLPDPAIVSQVMYSTYDSNVTLVKIQTRQTRRPEVGDKFSSRHGQKGVVGLLAEAVDLPFSDEGIVPDLIMNPSGLSSRMTVGKLIELVAGKAGVSIGKFQYGTAFSNNHQLNGSRLEDMADILIQRGYSYSGKDYLTSGTTGEPLEAYIFSGPIYYQKLKHMVEDKMHARSTGPKAILTRQPTEGRSRAGGLRLGEMERDCLIAYGASQLLIERLMLSSDVHEVYVCSKCGGMGHHGWCDACKTSAGVHLLQIPYAAKLLIQELLSMGINAKLKLTDAL